MCYFRPILEDIDHVLTEIGGDEGQPFFEELLPLSTKLQDHEQTITDLETENRIYRGRWSRWRPTPSAWRKNERTKLTRKSTMSSSTAVSTDQIDAMVDGISCSGIGGAMKKMSIVYLM